MAFSAGCCQSARPAIVARNPSRLSCSAFTLLLTLKVDVIDTKKCHDIVDTFKGRQNEGVTHGATQGARRATGVAPCVTPSFWPAAPPSAIQESRPV